MIHFELGNFDLLRYATKSTYRFLYKQDKLYTHEKIILDFIRKKKFNIRTRKKEIVLLFKQLKDRLLSHSKDPYGGNFDEYHHFIYWLDSKIEDKPLAEVIRDKSK